MASESAFDLATHAWYRRMLVPFLGTGATAVPIELACLRHREYEHQRGRVPMKMPQAPKNFEGVCGWMVNLIHIWTGNRDGTFAGTRKSERKEHVGEASD